MAVHPESLTAVQATLRQWRVAHPAATLAEIEEEVDRELSTVRSELVVEMAIEQTAAAPPVCPTCQRPMHRHGVRARHLLTRDEGQLTLPLPRYRCPVCGTELSPPR